MKKTVFFFLFLLFFVQPMAFAEEFDIGGVARTYEVFEPSGSPQGMVMVLHHLDGTAEQMKLLGFNRYAAKERFVVVYPEAMHGRWTPEDLDYLKKLADTLLEKYQLTNGIYVVGASSGGMMAQGFAAQYSEMVRAAAAVGSTLPTGIVIPENPVSMLFINGTNDPLVPFQGGNGFLPVIEAPRFWIQANQCDPTDPMGSREPFPSGDGTIINQEVFKSSNGAEVIFYVIEGGGHSWPGGPILPEAFFGKTCLHMNATDTIWNFFRRH